VVLEPGRHEVVLRCVTPGVSKPFRFGPETVKVDAVAGWTHQIGASVDDFQGVRCIPRELRDDPRTKQSKALVQAVLHDDRGRFQRLLEGGADPSHPVELPSEKVRGRLGIFAKVPPVVLAAEHEDPGFLELALAHGGDPSGRAEGPGGSALSRSLLAGLPGNSRRLIAAGDDLNAPDGEGRTALDDALLANEFELALLMLRTGADPSRAKEGGQLISYVLCLNRSYTGATGEAYRALLDAHRQRRIAVCRAVDD